MSTDPVITDLERKLAKEVAYAESLPFSRLGRMIAEWLTGIKVSELIPAGMLARRPRRNPACPASRWRITGKGGGSGCEAPGTAQGMRTCQKVGFHESGYRHQAPGYQALPR